MIGRQIEKELRTMLDEFPVVSILGPRQSGKTTLTRKALPSYRYINLEDPDQRAYAAQDPQSFFKDIGRDHVILDEIQRVPELLSYIQVIVDEQKINGQFVLTGSHQLYLQQGISQSLAGRTGILKLWPLSVQELKKAHRELGDFSNCAFHGFLPRVFDQAIRPYAAYQSYYKTYVERDVQQLIQIKQLHLFEKFIRLMAGRAGQILAYQTLANDVGTSIPTIKSWLSILEASFILYRLNPYYENFGKRVIKAPKYYFIETGLLVYLLGIEKPDHIQRDPLVGQIFENLVVMDAVKTKLNQGKDPNLYFYRDNNQNEVDLLYKQGRKFTAIEIKSAATFHPDMLKTVKKVQQWIPDCNGSLIYNGPTRTQQNTKLLHFSEAFTLFDRAP
jgi:predicted AAA+ superfamily ATPase